MVIYTVRPGDTLTRIAGQYGLAPETAAEANQLRDPARLVPGQTLVLPVETVEYTVRPGDSLYAIARRYGLTVSQLRASNPGLGGGIRILPGQRLTLSFSAPRLGTVLVNGYITDAGGETLDETLPYLTALSPFSYRTERSGELYPTYSVSVAGSAAFGTENLLTLTNLRSAGGFDPEAAHGVLTDAAVQDTFLAGVTELLEGGLWQGVNLDFEYIYPFDRDSYSQFLRRFAERLHTLGYPLFVAAAPKTAADQPGSLYAAHDYAAMGAAADYVVLMTYEWGYTYGPAMAVSPLNMVRRVLDYAVTAVPREKLLLGVPNYGYDWTLPFRQGTAARALSNPAATALAAEKGAEIRFDPRAQAPYFNYRDADGARHEVWFQDARSLDAMYRLAAEYGLGGISFWNLNRLYRTAFLVLESLYRVEKHRGIHSR